MEHAPNRIPKPQRIVEHRCMDCGSNVCFKDGNGVRRCERCGSVNVRLVDKRPEKERGCITGEMVNTVNQVIRVAKDAIAKCTRVDYINMTNKTAAISVDTEKINNIVRAAKEVVRQLQAIANANREKGTPCPNCGAPLEYSTVKLYADGVIWEERPVVECKYCGFIKEIY